MPKNRLTYGSRPFRSHQPPLRKSDSTGIAVIIGFVVVLHVIFYFVTRG